MLNLRYGHQGMGLTPDPSPRGEGGILFPSRVSTPDRKGKQDTAINEQKILNSRVLQAL
jgi:hypothetical protein